MVMGLSKPHLKQRFEPNGLKPNLKYTYRYQHSWFVC